MATPVTSTTTRGWRIAFLVLCTLGVTLSADLLRLHVNVHTDPHYHSYCAMNEHVNCETVAASDFAVILGLPLAVWGLLAYLMMGGLAIWGLRREQRLPSWPFGCLFWLSAVSSAIGVALFLVSHFAIRSLCIVCMGTYAVSLGLLVTSLVELRRSGRSLLTAWIEELGAALRRPAAPATYVGCFALVAAALWLAIPPYWQVVETTGPGGVRVGQTADAHPWIGAASPVLEILEYSDYQCPYCARAHSAMRQLAESHPDRVRLIHRNYPLDDACNAMLERPFHTFACQYARMAQCADRQGGFWRANDYLFANGRRRQPVTVVELSKATDLDAAAMTACLGADATEQAVQADLAAGQALKIRGTPTFVVAGRSYPGHIPPEILDAALNKTAPMANR